MREEVDKRISDMSVSYNEQLVIKETEKKDITRKLSQDFETRLQEVTHPIYPGCIPDFVFGC